MIAHSFLEKERAAVDWYSVVAVHISLEFLIRLSVALDGGALDSTANVNGPSQPQAAPGWTFEGMGVAYSKYM